MRTLELLQSRAAVVRPARTSSRCSPGRSEAPRSEPFLGLLLGLASRSSGTRSTSECAARKRSRKGWDPAAGAASRYAKKVRGRDSLVMLGDPRHHAAESVTTAADEPRTRAVGSDAKTIMVTSAAPKEGKSTTIANLAVALARAGHEVALVDLDLREPTIATCIRPGGTGRDHRRHDGADQPRRRARADPARIALASRAAQARDLHAGLLRVLPAGTTPPDPGEFVGAQRLAADDQDACVSITISCSSTLRRSWRSATR